ncbi:MAG: hypothetical protein CVU64_13560 [Deltaproteobacteria bacterium HGW-Deltaproteobacteria-21]|nr:MAG: hypothetical protein CVU64_13560 [Deltaproteobacteria bacterium HGW-Deltaproteobacteria-21]
MKAIGKKAELPFLLDLNLLAPPNQQCSSSHSFCPHEVRKGVDGSIIFEAEVAGTDEIRFWVMNWGSKAEVLEPASLKEEVRAEAEAIMSMYSESTKREKTAS